MKKIFVCALALMMLTLSLTACGNMSMGFGNYSFKHIHFTNMIEAHCATVESWHDNETGIEVKTTEFGSLYCSEGSYILFENGDKCPYCDE